MAKGKNKTGTQRQRIQNRKGQTRRNRRHAKKKTASKKKKK